MRRLYLAGNVESDFGSTHSMKTTAESVVYIDLQFREYLKYSGLSEADLSGKRVLEFGFGDNVGVALQFLAAGAAEVLCLDKFYARRDADQEAAIYQELRSRLAHESLRRFDEAITISGGVRINEEKLKFLTGVELNDCLETLAAKGQVFDLIISRAVMEEIYEPSKVFLAADDLLSPGGYILHKIDMSDYGVFSGAGLHPLTFLTISESVYRLMARDSGMPNRKLRPYYRQLIAQQGYDGKMLVSSIIGKGELQHYKERIELGVDYTESSVALVESIRPRLVKPFKEMPAEDLLVEHMFLAARKHGTESPGTNQGNALLSSV